MALGFTQLDGKENAWGEDGGGLFGEEGGEGGGMLGFGADLFGEEGGQSQRSYRLRSRSKRKEEVEGSEEYRRGSMSRVERSTPREEGEESRQEYAGRCSEEQGRKTSMASVESRSAVEEMRGGGYSTAEERKTIPMQRQGEKTDKQSGGVTASRPLCPVPSITLPPPRQPTAPVSVQTSIPTPMQTALVSAPCQDRPETSLGCALVVAAPTSMPPVQTVQGPAPTPQLSLACRVQPKTAAHPGLQPMQMPSLAKPTTRAAGPLQVTPANREDVKSGSELPKPPAKADPAPAVQQPTALAAMPTLAPARPIGVPVKPMAVPSMQLSLAPVARPPALPLPAAPRPVQTSVQPPLCQSLSNRTNPEQTSSVCTNKNNNQLKSAAAAGLELQKTVKLTVDGNQSRLVPATTPADTGAAAHHHKLPLPGLHTVPPPPSVGRPGSHEGSTLLTTCRTAAKPAPLTAGTAMSSLLSTAALPSLRLFSHTNASELFSTLSEFSAKTLGVKGRLHCTHPEQHLRNAYLRTRIATMRVFLEASFRDFDRESAHLHERLQLADYN